MDFLEEVYNGIEVDYERDKEIALYRYIPFDALLEIFAEKAIHLVNTCKWEDVYENFVLKDRLVTQDNVEYSATGVLKTIYGQSWTGKSSSDALWRIYSPDRKSVKIKTTINNLYTVANEAEVKCNANSILGRVVYYSKKTIEQKILSGEPYDYEKLIKLVAYSSFIKRKSFSHESEYRLLFIVNSKDDYNSDTIKVPVEPYSFIKNIHFDPRADKYYVDRCKKILDKLVHFPLDKVHQSNLYTFKPITIHTCNIKLGCNTLPKE